MFAFMIERLRDETKDMDLAIDTLNRQLKGVTAQQEEASLLLHQTASQRTRSAALAHTLARHMEAARTQRSGKLARVEETLAEQHARLRAYDEREQRRLNLSSMPRVRCHHRCHVAGAASRLGAPHDLLPPTHNRAAAHAG